MIEREIWTGQPKFTSTSAITWVFDKLGVVADHAVEAILIASFFSNVCSLCIDFFGLPYISIFPMVSIAVLIAVLWVLYVDRKEKRAMRYTITSEYILFNTWSLVEGFTTTQVPLNQVQRLSLVEEDNGVGTIYLMGENLGEFKNTEHFPALLSIQNPQEVLAKIQKAL